MTNLRQYTTCPPRHLVGDAREERMALGRDPARMRATLVDAEFVYDGDALKQPFSLDAPDADGCVTWRQWDAD